VLQSGKLFRIKNSHCEKKRLLELSAVNVRL